MEISAIYDQNTEGVVEPISKSLNLTLHSIPI